MSVYPRRDGIYVYDFWLQRLRFCGSTGCRNRRDAEQAERTRREEAKQRLAKIRAQRTGPMTVNVAFDRFWSEVGERYTGTYRKLIWASLEWLADQLGSNTLIRDIGTNRITELIARRRGQGVVNATVNRSVTEPLRRIMRRAKRQWEQDVPDIDWTALLLPEPRERIRELRTAEETQLFETMRADYLPALRFKLLYGLRKAEVVGLKWPAIDWTAKTVTIVGKGGKTRLLPLLDEAQAILAPLRDHHPEYVFTYVGRRTRQNPGDRKFRMRGIRYPITMAGLSSAWRRYGASAAGIEDFRLHDIRHTTGTRLLRESGNLRLVQKLLGHEHISTTTRYAHATDEDLREAMENLSKKSRPKSRQSRKHTA